MFKNLIKLTEIFQTLVIFTKKGTILKLVRKTTNSGNLICSKRLKCCALGIHLGLSLIMFLLFVSLWNKSFSFLVFLNIDILTHNILSKYETTFRELDRLSPPPLRQNPLTYLYWPP